MDVDNLMSGSSAFSRSSLYIWNFLVHVLLKPSLENFKHYFATQREVKWSQSRSVMSDFLWPHRLYNPWNSPGQNTGVDSLSLLQGIFPTQGLNPGFLHCRQSLYQLSHKGSPTSVWNECNCAIVWTLLALPFFGIGMKTDLFQSKPFPGIRKLHFWVFQICWHIEWSTFTA